MKLAMLAIFLLVVTFLSATVYAKDLNALAKRERARRAALSDSERGGALKAYDDEDLERYRREREPPKVKVRPRVRAVLDLDGRDLAKKRAHWRREAEKHRRELDRLDAGIRKLEWRLSERLSRRRAGERLKEDPAIAMLEDSLESLRAQRHRIDEEFRERARKAGALPGWLR
jgi:hypothetical protein